MKTSDSRRTQIPPEYSRNPKQSIVKHTEQGKPYRFSGKVDARVSQPQGKLNYLEGIGIWKKRRLLYNAGDSGSKFAAHRKVADFR